MGYSPETKQSLFPNGHTVYSSTLILTVFSEGDDLKHFPKPGEDLQEETALELIQKNC